MEGCVAMRFFHDYVINWLKIWFLSLFANHDLYVFLNYDLLGPLRYYYMVQSSIC